MDTKSVEHAYNLESVTKQISNLLLKTSRLNVLVDKLQKKANLGEKNSENGFSILSTSDAYNECSLKVMENNDSTGLDKIPFMENDEASDEENIEYKSDNECCSAGANIHNLSRNVNVPTIGSLTHNAVQYHESNINPYQPLGEKCETKFFKKLGTCSARDIGQKNSSTNRTFGDESIIDENKIEEDNPLNTLKYENGNDSTSEIEKLQHIKYENQDSTEIQREDSNISNIKPTEPIKDDTRTMMTSVTSYSTSRRSSRRRHEEDIYDERLFDAGQPKTVREWYQYTKQMTEYASARVRSGTVKLGKSPDVILVLDTSDRMAGYFQKLKSAALQYVYGIKQSSECGDLAIGVGLAVFGRETRLIQEATIDYELVIELIGNLRPEGDAHVLAGLLMGYAGVVSCFIGCYKDIVLQAHIIVFTNGSSEQCKLSTENGENYVPSDINGVIDEIVSTTTRIFYVPIGGNQCNNTLEQAVGKTNGKIIPANEMYRLITMTSVMLLAIQIASDIRYLEKQSREDIRRRISNHSSLDDKHEDCLDMIPDFINPLRFDNMKGLYLELGCLTLTLGDRVRRGPDWTYDDQDLGLPGTAVGYERRGWVIVEWDHGAIYPYPYDEHMDRLQLRKVNEPRVLVNELIAVGCRIVRGRDWKYGDHDGGKGTEGKVLGVKEEGKVVVRWDRKNIGIYKIGYNGRFEVKLSDNFSNDGYTIGSEEMDRYGDGEERYKETTTESTIMLHIQ
ncbi:unnamed protein product [Mytilus edulis]|uniref:MIB/HERC2 domain-containing protein n=1 Tax=Mytilus edulis TaxID=6550 RepID=A0A8S3SW81_MYTED|nr:unnamed protein product [Mytilus edulis]